MTQIVYDGEYLYADRKSYSDIDGKFDGETTKVKVISNNNVRLIYGFCGEFLDCAIGEQVVESFFDPQVCKDARERLSKESLNFFGGIVIETPVNNNGVHDLHRVFKVNYAGDKCEYERGKFLAVGAMCTDIVLAHQVATKFCDAEVDTEDLIRFVTNNTSQGQNGFNIDRIKIYTGVER